MRYPHLATRLFGVPLLIERSKLDIILAALEPRLLLAEASGAPEPAAYGPGDKGKSRKDYFVTEEGIGVIDIYGPLVKRASGDFLSGGPTTYGQIENEFMDAATDPAIQGILLQVDSPGGESTGAFELADLIYSQRGAKPIFAAVDGDAFSAAYALASSAEQVYLTKSGGVGSVGVWMMHVDQSAFNAKEGFNPTYIFEGARKIDGNPHQPLSKEAQKRFQGIVRGVYDMFVDTVARNRNMKAADVRDTEAGVFLGTEGTAIGFADQIGTVADALAALRTRVQQASSSRVASATNSQKKEGSMPDETKPADATEKPAPAQTEGAVNTGALKAAARAEEFARCREIVGLCALSGMTARAALKFLKPDASVESVRQQLLDQRGTDEPEIHSHILPDAGTGTSAKTEDSPIVKAAEKLAAVHAAKGAH